MYIYIYIGFRIERPSCRIAKPQCRVHADAIGIHPGSPAWHRRLRRKRAAARARIRSARSAHQEPPASDLVFLSRHHTRPALRELRQPMGKRGGWEGQQYGQGYGRYSSQGAYYEKDWYAKGHGKRQGEGSQGGTIPCQLPILRDDAHPRGQSGQGHRASRASGSRAETAEMGDARSDTSDLTKFVQKLVNVIRRSDGKLRKCEKDQVEAEAQWQEYQKGLQRAFMKERQRYKDKVQQMKKEQDEHTKMKDNAIRELRGLIEHPERALTNVIPEAEDVAMDEWRDLITTPVDPWEDLPRLMADAAHGGAGLQDAARKQLMGALGVEPSGERVERTPPRRPQQPPPMTPANADKRALKEHGAGDGDEATYAGGLTPAAQDPYLTSPSTSGAPLPSMRTRSRSHTQGPRVSIKAHTRGAKCRRASMLPSGTSSRSAGPVHWRRPRIRRWWTWRRATRTTCSQTSLPSHRNPWRSSILRWTARGRRLFRCVRTYYWPWPYGWRVLS